jgi:hypothetical protein
MRSGAECSGKLVGFTSFATDFCAIALPASDYVVAVEQ